MRANVDGVESVWGKGKEGSLGQSPAAVSLKERLQSGSFSTGYILSDTIHFRIVVSDIIYKIKVYFK